jgi:hypothetical protein
MTGRFEKPYRARRGEIDLALYIETYKAFSDKFLMAFAPKCALILKKLWAF